LGKAVLDAGNKILYLDDSQVVRTTTEKIKSPHEEIRILMRRMRE
jgi:Holliday junction resolvase RusA-like endonuclease